MHYLVLISIDYVAYSGNVFEVASINGLMDYIEEMNSELYTQLYTMFVKMRDITDNVMLAAETSNLKNFFCDNVENNESVIVHIDNAFKILPENFKERCLAIKKFALANNSPEVRIKRMLRKR